MNRIDTSTDTQKLMAASLPAITITFLLFAMMQQLIGTERVSVQPRFVTLDDELPEPRKDSQANTIVRVLPEPPKMMPPPEPVSPEVDDYAGPTIGLPVEPVLPAIDLDDATELTALDKSATAMVRIDPSYPADAATNGIEGWVKLRFSIDATGAVFDVQILDAEPRRVFEREAIKALKSWKYQPQFKQGKAVVQTGMQVQLDFSLDKA